MATSIKGKPVEATTARHGSVEISSARGGVKNAKLTALRLAVVGILGEYQKNFAFAAKPKATQQAAKKQKSGPNPKAWDELKSLQNEFNLKVQTSAPKLGSNQVGFDITVENEKYGYKETFTAAAKNKNIAKLLAAEKAVSAIREISTEQNWEKDEGDLAGDLEAGMT